jgi:hypothetical protein
VEIELAFELIKNFITFVDVELFAATGAAVNHRDEIGVLPYRPAPAPFVFVRVNPLLKVEFAQMWKHICTSMAAQIETRSKRSSRSTASLRSSRYESGQ